MIHVVPTCLKRPPSQYHSTVSYQSHLVSCARDEKLVARDSSNRKFRNKLQPIDFARIPKTIWFRSFLNQRDMNHFAWQKRRPWLVVIIKDYSDFNQSLYKSSLLWKLLIAKQNLGGCQIRVWRSVQSITKLQLIPRCPTICMRKMILAGGFANHIAMWSRKKSS